MRCVQLFSAASNCASQHACDGVIRLAYEWDHFGRVLREVLGELVIVNDEMRNVDVAVVLLH